MADAVSQDGKSQKVAQEVGLSKLLKAAIVAVFVVLLPFFPSEAPDFINRTINARSWELLQLVFVGIAVSYGLFSRKNNDSEKECALKLDNAQSYVSKLLQVSSVFDDESESPTVIDSNKVQMWNSQCYMEESVVVLAKESSDFKEENGSSGQRQKPLLLPVRSLKQADLVRGLRGKRGSSSQRFYSSSRKLGNEEFEGLECERKEGDAEENVVLPSPIPWRSRSGRMDVKGNDDGRSYFLTFVEDSILDGVELRSLKSSLPSSSPKKQSVSSSQKLYHSTPFSFDSQAQSSEDVEWKNPSSSPSVPPPPPPPQPQSLRKSVMTKSNSGVMDGRVSAEKVMRRSLRSVPTDSASESEVDEHPRGANSGSDMRGRSVRTFRPNEPTIGVEKFSKECETKFIEKKGHAITKTTENAANAATQNHSKLPVGENRKFDQKVIKKPTCEESDAESEDACSEGSSRNREAAIDNNVSDSGPDVDKKADEFIAKFREQIRLQRIESIRRSTTQRPGKTSA